MSATTPGKWRLSSAAFERLLRELGPDREAASREYEALRRRLIHFFDWKGSLSPEAATDETLDRLARKLEEGETIANLGGYLRAVARHVLQESERRHSREQTALDEASREADRAATREDADARIPCLKRCLSRLPEDSRTLILSYYQGEGKAHLVERKALARRLGLTYATLKSRAHRSRGLLEECVRRCLEEQTAGNR